MIYKIFLVSLLLFSCKNKNKEVFTDSKVNDESEQSSLPYKTFKSKHKTIHIIVALCDNKYQGIVPVPQSIGNGQDPKNNLYWGTAYGIKTYFKRSAEWTLIKEEKMSSHILERLVFKHKNKDFFIVADAYDGQYIKATTETFLSSSAGIKKDTINVNNQNIGILGNASLVAYIGHDGLMDFNINKTFKNTDDRTRDIIILACYSKSYFKPHLQQSKVNPILWTTGLMAPEAYTIHDALTGYVNGESNEQIRLRAAKAYHKYQKCGLKGAKNLLITE